MLPSSNSCPPPCSDLTSGMSLGFQRWDFPSLVAALAVMWSCNMRRAVLEHLFGSGWDIPCGGPGKSVSHLHGFKLPSLPCFRRKKVCASRELSPGFPQLSCQFHQSPKRPRGLVFPLSEPRTGAPICGWNFPLPRADLHLCDLFLWVGPFPGGQVPT